MEQQDSLIARFEKTAHLWDEIHFANVSPASKTYTEAKHLVDQHDKVMSRVLAIRKRIERINDLIERDKGETKHM